MPTRRRRFFRFVIWLVAVAATAATSRPGLAAPDQAGALPRPPGSGRARLAFEHALPPLDGSKLQVKLVEVIYAPGEASPPHSHPCVVIGHVVEGAIRTHVKGDAETIVKAGESFYEPPNGHHLVSANASATAPARLLAYFVCDRETPLSVPLTGAAR